MKLEELRAKFVEYFLSKGYLLQPPASLIPSNDPSVLFTTAGMQQFKNFYSSPKEASASAVISVQPVIRTSDIAAVGDDTHLTNFEMLGNFRFGEKSSMKMKQRAIDEAWKLVTEGYGVKKDRVYVTVFGGDKQAPADTESEGIWQSLGVHDIRQCNREENFWGPTGDEGPCGPNTEIYVDGVEIWNLVFNQYYRSKDGKYTELETFGLDTGSGLERVAMVLAGKSSIWEIEPFKSWVGYTDSKKTRESRIIIDHLRSAIFLISDGILPGNKGREYVLRRLIRKVVYLISTLTQEFDYELAIGHIKAFYENSYQLSDDKEILEVILKERDQFSKNISLSVGYLEKWLNRQGQKPTGDEVTKLAFNMYESFGFPKEMVFEFLQSKGVMASEQVFETLFKKHQETSRAGLDKQFKGGLADHQEQTIKHHTAHHLLLAALRRVLGDSVVQRGSNVNSDRLRIDFSFDRKLTEAELDQVEKIVNDKIKEDLPVVCQEMSKERALKSGALAEFGQSYGDKVTVYSIGPSTGSGQAFSKELCGGPHMERTGQLGRFKILKEEASSQGVRRVKARVFYSSTA